MTGTQLIQWAVTHCHKRNLLPNDANILMLIRERYPGFESQMKDAQYPVARNTRCQCDSDSPDWTCLHCYKKTKPQQADDSCHTQDDNDDEPNDSPTCIRCGATMHIPDGYEITTICGSCAQLLIGKWSIS